MEDKITKREKRRKLNRIWMEVKDWSQSFIIAFLVFIIIFGFLLINARVPTPSMEPTLMVKTRLIVNRLAYVFGDPIEYDDIVIFPAPDDKKTLYIKRVVGVAGDKIEIKDGITYRNDEIIEEPYVVKQTGSYGPYYVPDDCIFVMGDNRDNSWDARFWDEKYVKIKDVKGKAMFTIWPLNELKLLNN